MPTHNDTGNSSDYQVNNPPPGAPAPLIAGGGAAMAFAGSTMMFVGGLGREGNCLLIFGYLVTLAGLGLVVAGIVLGLKRGFCWIRRGARYHLEPGQFSLCPHRFLAGDIITFYAHGTDTVLATATIPHEECLATLSEVAALTREASGSAHEVSFTPP